MQDFTPFAFNEIDADLRFLIVCFREVLADLGRLERAVELEHHATLPAAPMAQSCECCDLPEGPMALTTF